MAEECRSCHAEIYWATAEQAEDGKPEKSSPIDKATLGGEAGNLDTWRDGQGVLRYRYIRKAEQAAALPEGHLRAVSHFATCAQAASWRKRRAGAGA